MIPFFVQPLSVFPSLLDYTFFAPLILRLGAGLVVLLLAYRGAFAMRETTLVMLDSFPFMRPKGLWITLAFIGHTLIGLCLIFGLYTQVAAILGALIGLKLIILRHVYNTDFRIDNTACFLLIVACLALLIAGPGAFAIDLPL